VCVSVLVAGPSAATVTPGVKPDIVLTPANRTFNKQYDSLLVNDLTPQADASVVPTADQCRDLPPLDLLCDVYRIKIVRDRTPGAANFVQILVSWERIASTPALPLAAAGLGESDLPDLDLFLYKDADTYIDYAEVGGRGSIIPERLAFEATQDEYDLVVRAGTGATTGYAIKATMSNELFDKPFELIEDETSAPSAQPPAADRSGAGVGTDAGTAISAPLALAPLDSDQQIAGIGLGTTEQFDAAADLGRNAIRNAAATTKAPSALILWLTLVIFPAALVASMVLVLRRRHTEFA
jgi:hypothetical protein